MFAVIRKLRQILSPVYKWILLILTGMMVFGALLELFAIGMIMVLISAFTSSSLEKPLDLSSRYLELAYRFSGAETPRDFVIRAAVALIVFYILKNVYGWCSLWCQTFFTTKLTISISHRMYRNYLEAPYEWHVRTGATQLIERLNQVMTFSRCVLWPCMLILTEAIVALTIILVLFLLIPKIALIAALFTVSLIFLLYLPMRKIIARFGETSVRAGIKAMLFMTQGLAAVREVKLTGSENYFERQLDQVQAKKFFSSKRVSDFSEIPRFVMEALSITTAMVILLYLLQTDVPFSEILLTAALLISAMFRLLPSFSRIQYNLFQLRSYFFLFDLIYSDLTDIPKEEPQVDAPPLTFERDLVLDHVTFSYGPDAPPVIRDLNLKIGSRESIAVIGKTGCGKTTLINLILGFYEPVSGRILSDGTDISANRRGWRSRIGYVPQNIVLFDDTVSANIAFGVPPEEIDRARLREVMDIARVSEFLPSLPEGAETVIGESGVRLSGGQRQRIALARALYHRPQLLILDEATSALDNETESAVIQSLKTLQGHIAIIMIAHRMSSIRYCDRTISLEKNDAE